MAGERWEIPPVAQVPSADIADFVRHLRIEKFETARTCAERQLAMIERLHGTPGFTPAMARPLQAQVKSSLPADWLRLSAACHFARRAVKLEVLTAHREALLSRRQPRWLVTYAPSAWEIAPEELPRLRPNLLAGRFARALSRGILASGAVEIVHVRHPDRLFIAPHIHAVCAAHDIAAIRPSLRALHDVELNRRPLRIDAVRPGDEGIVLNYVHKQVARMRVPYTDAGGFARVRRLPLADDWLSQVDAWLLTLPANGLSFTVGMKRNGRFLVAT